MQLQSEVGMKNILYYYQIIKELLIIKIIYNTNNNNEFNNLNNNIDNNSNNNNDIKINRFNPRETNKPLQNFAKPSSKTYSKK